MCCRWERKRFKLPRTRWWRETCLLHLLSESASEALCAFLSHSQKHPERKLWATNPLYLSEQTENLLKREKKDFSPFNIRKRGCVPSYNKEPLLRPDPSDRPAPASRLLRSCLLFSCLHPKSWHELRVLAESSYSAVLGLTDLAVFAYPYLLQLCPRIFYISSNIICLSLPYFFFSIACLYFFSNRFSATLKRSRPQSDSHTTLTAHSHIHGTLNHKSHSQGLGGSMWECEPT